MNHRWISCSFVPPFRTRLPISLNADATIESTLSRAAKCDRICSSVHVDSNCATRSAELTMFFPRPRNRSTVPASTREIVNTLLFGEYCIARSRCLARIAFSLLKQFLPTGILISSCPAGNRDDRLDFVHQLDRIALSRNR